MKSDDDLIREAPNIHAANVAICKRITDLDEEFKRQQFRRLSSPACGAVGARMPCRRSRS